MMHEQTLGSLTKEKSLAPEFTSLPALPASCPLQSSRKGASFPLLKRALQYFFRLPRLPRARQHLGFCQTHPKKSPQPCSLQPGSREQHEGRRQGGRPGGRPLDASTEALDAPPACLTSGALLRRAFPLRCGCRSQARSSRARARPTRCPRACFRPRGRRSQRECPS